MLEIPPELDFTSEQFDPALSLAAKDRIYLPYPKAKVYNNLADWYFHTFKKKKNDILSNQESKTASKNNVYVLNRNYEWYFDTLGLDLPDDFDIQSRNKKYTKRKRNLNGKYQIDKRVVVKEMPSEMLEPMRSSKILIKRCDGSLRGFALVGTDPTSRLQEHTKSVNSSVCESKLENKIYGLESEKLLSPLKSLNNIPSVEFKKCDNSPPKSHTDCFMNKSSIVKPSYSKGSTKEIALLELARRARKRLHMQ